jgi:UPF0288 family protein (methanogenesis marker protein 3)
MADEQDVKVLTDLSRELNQAAATLEKLQQELSANDPDNDVVSHLIGRLTEQALTVQTQAVELALAMQDKALQSVKVATVYLRKKAGVITDVNTGISIFGGLVALGAAITAGNPGGCVSAASTLIALIGSVKSGQPA